MVYLLGLSHEVLHSILCEVAAEDLATLSRCCRTLNSFIQSNRLLWKELYLRSFDDIPRGPTASEPDYEGKLPTLIAFKKLLQSDKLDLKRAWIARAAQVTTDLLQNSSTGWLSSLNIAWLSNVFSSQQNLDVFLCSSSLFEHTGRHGCVSAETEVERQLSAKLHVLFGVPIDCSSRKDAPTHPFARARVYDLRNYTDGTFWGPFVDDGRQTVDWEKLESIMILLAYNLKKFRERTHGRFEPMWNEPWVGATPNSFSSPTHQTKSTDSARSPLLREPGLPLDAQDPFGVTGTWMRIVCFLDYSDLYSFNFETQLPPPGQPRGPLEREEAIRLIALKLRTTKIEAPGEDDGQSLPVVHFAGTSRSMHASWDPNANSKIRGTVRLTPEGQIRWTTFSIFYGEERWRSEGIQIGGIRSSRGILGTWFDKDYDPHGPAGPTAFWKVSDEIVEGKCPASVVLH